MTHFGLDALEPRQLFATGDPVTTFGRQGLAKTPYALYAVDISDVAAAPGGKLLAALDYQSYTATEGVPADFVRFNADGQPDTTFGTSGLGTADSFLKTVRRIAVRKDGYFYAFGSDSDNQIYVSNTANWYVARFRPDGVIDRRFGDRGHVQLDMGRLDALGSGTIQNNVSLNSDGQVTMLANYRTLPGVYAPAVVRFDATGARDTRFHSGRPVLLGGAGDDARPTLATSADGQTYVAYNRTSQGVNRATVMRLTAGGGLDDGFGRNGYFTFLNRPLTFPMISLAPGSTGNTSFAVGGAYNDDGSYGHTTVLAKLTGGGHFDPSFAGDGEAEWTDEVDGHIDVTLLADGRILTSGRADSRIWNTDGTQDTAAGRFGVLDRPLVQNGVIYSSDSGTIRATQLTSTGSPSPVTLSSNGTLQVTGGGRADYLAVHSENDFGQYGFANLVIDGASWTRTVRVSQVKLIRIDGGSGDDNITTTIFPTDGVTNPKLIIHGGPGYDYINVYNYRATVFGDSDGASITGNKVTRAD